MGFVTGFSLEAMLDDEWLMESAAFPPFTQERSIFINFISMIEADHGAKYSIVSGHS